ncbi:hypothetical protein [Sanyastnella coralliicola]|uniref:hypothetical protein n=1 Tax=Sanyastnella coralliicola TaxID=3069118 RepID=UPI0027BA438A|nr:hypothetical protein [Longitalea sp. SCSIO 12813]
MRTLCTILLGCLLLIDLGHSALQHFYMPLDGDLPCGVIPDHDVQAVLDDPLGWKAMTDQRHVNPNRFFSHAALFHFYQEVPVHLHSFVEPTNTPYLANAILKTMLQLAFVLVLTRLVIGRQRFFQPSTFAIALLIELCFVNYDFGLGLGIIDSASSYLFFYAIPLFFFLWFVSPMAERFASLKRIPTYRAVLGIILIPALFLSGPLNPAILLVLFASFAIAVIFPSFRSYLFPHGFPYLSGLEHSLFFISVLFAAYSFYLGLFDTIASAQAIPVSERYYRWLFGVQNQLLSKTTFHVLLGGILLSSLTLRLFTSLAWKGFSRLCLFLGLFSILYIVLLPLGGFRVWRPEILRNDVLSPVTIALIICLARGCWLILTEVKAIRVRTISTALIFPAILYLGFNDKLVTTFYDCQQEALQQIANSKGQTVIISGDCTLAHWWLVKDPEESRNAMQMLELWEIAGEAEVFVQE